MGNYFYGKEALEPEDYLKLKEETDRLKEIYSSLDTLTETENTNDAIYNAVTKFEAGEVSDKHNNPGNIFYRDWTEDKYGATQGDPVVEQDENGNLYETGEHFAYFPDKEVGEAATRDLIQHHFTELNKQGQSPNRANNNLTFGQQFAQTYTGSPDPEVIANYGSEIDKNIANIKSAPKPEYKTLTEQATGGKSDIVSKAELINKFRFNNPFATNLTDEQAYRKIQQLAPEEIDRLNDPTWLQSSWASLNQATKNAQKAAPQLSRFVYDTQLSVLNTSFGIAAGTVRNLDKLASGEIPSMREVGDIVLGEKFDPDYDYRKAYLSGDKDPKLFDIMKKPGIKNTLDVTNVVNLMTDENREKVFNQIAYNEVIDKRKENAAQSGTIGSLSPELSESEQALQKRYKNMLYQDFAGLHNVTGAIDEWEKNTRDNVAKSWKETIEKNPDIVAAMLWTEGEKLTEGQWSRAKISELAAGVLPSQGFTKATGVLGALLAAAFTKGKSLFSAVKGANALAKNMGTGYVWGSTFGGFVMEGSAHYEEGMEYLTNDREITKAQFNQDIKELKESINEDYFKDSDTYFDYEIGQTFTKESLLDYLIKDNYTVENNKYFEKAMDYRQAADAVSFAALSHGAIAAVIENLEARVFTSVAYGKGVMTKHMLDKKGLQTFGNLIEKYNRMGRRIISGSKRKFGDKTLAKIGFTASRFGILGTTEGLEEVLQGMSNEAHAAWTWRRENYQRDWETVAQEFTGGFLGALMLGGGSSVSQGIRGTQRIGNLTQKFNSKFREGTFTTVKKDKNTGEFVIMQTNNYYDDKNKWVSETEQLQDYDKNDNGLGYITHSETGKKVPTRFNRYRDALNTSKVVNKAYGDIFKILDVYDYRSVLDGSAELVKSKDKDDNEVWQLQIKSKDGDIKYKKNYKKKNEAISSLNNTKNYLDKVYEWSLDYGGIENIMKTPVVQNHIETNKSIKSDAKARANKQTQDQFKKDNNIPSDANMNITGQTHSTVVLAVDSHMGVDVATKYPNNKEAEDDINYLEGKGLNENPEIIADELEKNPEYWENSDFTPEEFFDTFDDRYQDAPNYQETKERIAKSIPQEIYDNTIIEDDSGPKDSQEETGPEGLEQNENDQIGASDEELEALTGVPSKKQKELKAKKAVTDIVEKFDKDLKEDQAKKETKESFDRVQVSSDLKSATVDGKKVTFNKAQQKRAKKIATNLQLGGQKGVLGTAQAEEFNKDLIKQVEAAESKDKVSKKKKVKEAPEKKEDMVTIPGHMDTMGEPETMTREEAEKRLDQLLNPSYLPGEEGAEDAMIAGDEIRALQEGLAEAKEEKDHPLLKAIKEKFDREKRKLDKFKLSNETNKEEIVKKRLDALFTTFNKKIKYELVSSENAPKGRENEIAWITGNTVYINSDIMDVTAPFHEFSHPFILDLRLENKELFDSIVKNIKTNDKKLWNQVKDKYSDKSLIVQEEELFAHKLEDLAGKQPENNDNDNKIVKAFKKFFEWMKNKFFGTTSKKDIYANSLDENTTIEDLAEMIINQEGRYTVNLSEKTLEILEIGEDALTKNQEKYGYNITTKQGADGNYYIDVTDMEKFEKIPFQRFKKEIDSEILNNTEAVNENQLEQKLLERIEIDGLGLRSESRAELQTIFENVWTELKSLAKKQKTDNKMLVNPWHFAGRMMDNIPTWSMSTFNTWYESKFEDLLNEVKNQTPEGRYELYNSDNYVLNDDAINNEVIDYVNEIDFLSQDLEYKMATNEKNAIKNELGLERIFNVILTKKQIDSIYISAKHFFKASPGIMKNVYNIEEEFVGSDEQIELQKREAWIKNLLKNIIRRRYSTVTDFQMTDLIKTYNRIYSSVSTNTNLVRAEENNEFALNDSIPQRNDKNNLEILFEPKWTKVDGKWKLMFNLTEEVGLLIPRYKSQINPMTGKSNNKREKSTLAQYLGVNEESPLVWLSSDDIYMYENVTYYDDKKKKYVTVTEIDGPDAGKPKKKFTAPFNAMSEENIKNLAIGLKSAGYAIAFSRSDSGNLAIVKVTDYHKNLAKNATKFWNEQIDKGFITNQLDDEGNIIKTAESKVAKLMRFTPVEKAREIAVYLAANHVYPGYLNDLKGGANVYDRLKIPFTPVTISPSMPSIKVERFNPKEVLFRGALTDIKINGVQQRSFESHSPFKSEGLPKGTYIGDGKTITSQETFDLFYEHHGLRKTTAKAKTVIYYKNKRKSLMFKHQHMLPTRNWEITDLDGNVLYTIDNKRNIKNANGDTVHFLTTDDELKVGGEIKGENGSSSNGMMTEKNNSLTIPGQSIGFIKFDEHSKQGVKHAAQPYNHIYDEKVLDAFFDKYLPSLNKNLRQSYLLGTMTEEQLEKNPEIQTDKVYQFLKTYSGVDAMSFVSHAVNLAEAGAGLHTSISPMVDTLLMTKKILPDIEFSNSEGSVYDIDMDETGTLNEGEISLSVQNATDIKRLYAKNNDKPIDKKSLNNIPITDINDWLQSKIDDGNPIKVLVTRYPSSHIGSSAMLTVSKLHSRRALAVMNYIDVKGRFEGDQDGDEVHVELLGDNSENDSITKAWVDMFDKANIENINLDDFVPEGKKPFDLTDVFDRLRLITAFSAGAKAIGQIANVQTVYSTLIQTVDTINIATEDATGVVKNIPIRIKQPDETIKFSEGTYQGKLGGWQGTVSDYLRIWLQAAVDNSKYNLLYEWNYTNEMLAEMGQTGQRRLFATLFEVAEDTDFATSEDLGGLEGREMQDDGKSYLTQGDSLPWDLFMTLMPMINQTKKVGRLRDGRDENYKKLGASDYINQSSLYLDYVNTREDFLNQELLEKQDALEELINEPNIDVSVKLKDSKYKTENGKPLTALEAIVTAPAQVYDEMSQGRGLFGFDISPTKININLHEKAHMSAMADIESKLQTLINEAAKKDGKFDDDTWIQNQIKIGEDYALAMGSSFYNALNNIENVGIQTQDRHEKLQEHMQSFSDMFNKLSNTAKLSATQKFMVGFSQLAGVKGMDRHYTPIAPMVLPGFSLRKSEPSLLDAGYFKNSFFPVYNKTANENRLKRLMQQKNIKFSTLGRIFKCN
tara:strand:+ start:166 stop:9351 length:9186 start_codon:yes stop_codon:yes gene_type:complete